MSDSVRPHRQQLTRLLHPWDSPGKSTGVGCHYLLQFYPELLHSFGPVWASTGPLGGGDITWGPESASLGCLVALGGGSGIPDPWDGEFSQMWLVLICCAVSPGKGLASLNLLALGVQEPSGTTKSTTGEGQESRPAGACRAMSGMRCRKQPLYPGMLPLDMGLHDKSLLVFPFLGPLAWESRFFLFYFAIFIYACWLFQVWPLRCSIQVIGKRKGNPVNSLQCLSSSPEVPRQSAFFLLSWSHIELFPLYLIVFQGEKRKIEPNILFLKNKYRF